jgi:hypothetical protein
MTPRLASTLVLLAAAAHVAGCGGSSRGAAASGVTIAGQASYERPLVDAASATLSTVTTRVAIRGAQVELVQGGAVVAVGATDDAGRFALQAPADGTFEVRVTPRAALVDVRGHDGAQALLSVAGVTSAWAADLVATTRPLAGAFNIFDRLLRGLELVRSVEPDVQLPPLAVVWTAEGPNRTTTSFDRARLTLDVLDDPLADTDCFDDAVLLHELGHYLQTACSGDSTPGGAHLPGQDLDPRLAFAEGWATAFGQAVLGDPRYVDTRPGGGTTVDLARPSTQPLGPGSESAIHGLLWAMIEADGFAPVWRAMRALRGVPHASVRDLREALLATGALDAARWDAAAAPLGLAAPLPELGPALPLGAALQGTVNAALGQDSLRAASAYALVTVPPGAGLSVTLDAQDDLDLLVDGPDGSRFASRTAGQERLDLLGPAGIYLLRAQARSGSARAAFTLTAR